MEPSDHFERVTGRDEYYRRMFEQRYVTEDETPPGYSYSGPFGPEGQDGISAQLGIQSENHSRNRPSRQERSRSPLGLKEIQDELKEIRTQNTDLKLELNSLKVILTEMATFIKA